MMTTKRNPILTSLSIALIAAFAIAVPGLEAAGGSSAPPSTNPVDAAAAAYERGLKARDKAWELEKAMEAADPSDRERLAFRVDKQFEKAARAFKSATEDNPKMYQAFSSLGYSLRKSGDYDGSLAAYNEALEINPGYVEAIEYRAEAYLGLDRLDEAKNAYLQLFREDRERADELMTAMQSWVEDRKDSPGSLDASAVQEFTSWVEERAEVAGNTARLSTGGSSWSSD
jgi:tetratricopeptide (TPR) repeat protein